MAVAPTPDVPPIDPGVDRRSPAPSFWRYARKCVWAIIVGVVVAGGTITAAFADEHVTLSEGAAIGLAVLGAIAGPVGVYRAGNATKPRALAAVPPPATTPVVRAHVDGTVDLAWPDGQADRALVSRQLLEAMVDQHNKLTQRAAGR